MMAALIQRVCQLRRLASPTCDSSGPMSPSKLNHKRIFTPLPVINASSDVIDFKTLATMLRSR
jgi:hypothetical protein